MIEWKNGPYTLDIEAGKSVAVCTCRRSESPPTCDGNHSKDVSAKRPNVITLPIGKTVRICGCGKSKRSSYCDESHKELN